MLEVFCIFETLTEKRPNSLNFKILNCMDDWMIGCIDSSFKLVFLIRLEVIVCYQIFCPKDLKNLVVMIQVKTVHV